MAGTRGLMVRPLVPGTPVVITQSYGVENELEPLGYYVRGRGIHYEAAGGGELGHWHNGVDYALPLGTPLQAACDGVVELAGLSPTGFGLRLCVFGPEYGFLYGHLGSIAVRVGESVKRGQIVAASGGAYGNWRDGNSTGAHLHFSVVGKRFWYKPPHEFVG